MITTKISNELYKQIIENIPIACVDIAIVRDGAILLVLRKDKPAKGFWWLPGGRVFKGEKMVDTAKRKALEEVGIDCVVGPLVHTAETIFPDGPYGTSIHSINSCFLLYPKGRAHPKLDKHQTSYRFISYLERELHPYVMACLRGCGLNWSPTHDFKDKLKSS